MTGGEKVGDGWGAGLEERGKKKALCGNRRPSNDCLPYEKSSENRCCGLLHFSFSLVLCGTKIRSKGLTQ